MENNYLPRQATISEACEWLQEKTGEQWTLARLIECSLMPWFWLDYRADADAVFAGRKQGYLAPLCFAGDAGRLAAGGRDVLVTMTRNHAGEIIGLPPGSLVLPLDGLRFMRDDITWLAGKFSALTDTPDKAVPVVERSITKQQAINTFEGIYLDRNGWNNALSDVPKWIEPCRVSRGRKGDKSTSATWNPVLIAVALFDKSVTTKKLNAVFVRLPDWADEWREASASFPD